MAEPQYPIFHIYGSDVYQKPYNTEYKHPLVISSPDQLAESVCHDITAPLFANYKRSNDNYLQADCIFMDIDNDEEEDSHKWLTPESVSEMLGVCFYVTYSRNHLKDKSSGTHGHVKKARPRFHLYFPLAEPVTSPETHGQYAQLLYFKLGRKADKKALDADTLSNTKKIGELLRGRTIVEFPELAGLSKADRNKVKSCLSTSRDSYRPAYSAHVTNNVRTCIFIGTTNEETFLSDTENRRFLPVVCDGTKIKKHAWLLTEEDIAQVWAETKTMVDRGLWQTVVAPKHLKEVEQAQKDAIIQDDRLVLLEKFLAMPVPTEWDSLAAGTKTAFVRAWLNDSQRFPWNIPNYLRPDEEADELLTSQLWKLEKVIETDQRTGASIQTSKTVKSSWPAEHWKPRTYWSIMDIAVYVLDSSVRDYKKHANTVRLLMSKEADWAYTRIRLNKNRQYVYQKIEIQK